MKNNNTCILFTFLILSMITSAAHAAGLTNKFKQVLQHPEVSKTIGDITKNVTTVVAGTFGLHWLAKKHLYPQKNLQNQTPEPIDYQQ